MTQELELQEKRSVRDNLRHALRAFSDPYKSERVEDLIRICRLSDLEERRPEQLSGGQRQRVVWAVKLADEPELLLLDEPFSHLDVMLKNEMTEVLTEIHQALGITIVMVTHDRAEALSLADKVLLLKKGKLEMFASPQKIYKKPATSYAAAFFGEVNIFSSKQLGLLGVDPRGQDGKWLLRPEDVTLSTGGRGVAGKVTAVQFRGFYYVVFCKTDQKVALKVFSATPLKVGSACVLGWQSSKLHRLGK